MRKILSVLLIALTLSACSNRSGTELSPNQINVKETLYESNIPRYDQSPIDLPIKDSFVLSAAKSDNKLFFYATDVSGKNTFYEYDTDKNICTELNLNVAGTIYGIDAEDGCLYVLVCRGENTHQFNVKVYNSTTNSTESVTLSESAFDNDRIGIEGFAVVSNQFYINTFDCIYCLDHTGQIIHKNSVDKPEYAWKGIIHSSDGDSLMAYSIRGSDFVIQELDTELQINATYVLETDYSQIFQGFTNNQIYVMDSNTVYSLDLESGQKEAYVNPLLYNLSTTNFIPLSDELFFTIQNGVPTLWYASDEDDSAELTVLKCATYGVTYELRLAVSLFNFNHDDTKIEIVDYSSFDNGLTKLLVEIGAGNVPDIFDLSSIPLNQLSSLGILENLEDSLENKGIVPNILDTLRKDEGIFELVPGFRISSMAGSNKYFSTSTMSAETLLDAAEKAALEGKHLFPQYMTKEDFILFVLAFSDDSFVDIETGYCNFEDEVFANLIQFASELPSSNNFDETMYAAAVKSEDTEILNGEQLLSFVDTGNPVLDLLRIKTLHGADAQFIGFPTTAGTGVAMTPFLRMAMSSVSTHKDDVWTFFDYLLSEDFQTQMSTTDYLPVIYSALDTYIDSIIAGFKETPLKIAVSNTILECPLIDDTTEKDVWDLIERVDCINEYDTNIYNIVLQECQPFFAGEKDISEIQSQIQRRTLLYVHEQYDE